MGSRPVVMTGRTGAAHKAAGARELKKRRNQMKNISYGFIVLGLVLCLATPARAGLSIGIGIGLPNVSIGINLPLYPELVPVPGYPVYYAPGVEGNYFFYDGMYWVYQDDNWYASSWYNGPWGFVDPNVVPLFILRVPVGYYRQPPPYFHGWHSQAPPRWGQHWGRSWEERRGGWDRWQRSSAPRPAPLPTYQRRYSGDRYPRVEQQRALHNQQYRYQPREKAVRQHFKQVEKQAPAPQRGRQDKPESRGAEHKEIRHQAPRQDAPAGQRPQLQQQRNGGNQQRPVPAQSAPRQQGPAQEQAQQPGHAPREQKQQPAAAQREQKQQPVAVQREQHAPQQEQGRKQQRDREPKSQDKGDAGSRGDAPERGHGQGQDKDGGRGR